MMIPKQFPAYINERALFIVTGTEEAEVYLASNGEIENIERFRVKPPIFDAKEKSIYPLKTNEKQMHLKEFVKAVSEHAMKIVGREKLDHAYLFTPSSLKNALRDALPTRVTSVLRKTVEGNHLDASTVELLSILHT